MLAVWGKNDPFFLPQGAEAFRRDIPDAEIQFVDAGHLPLETHLDEVAGIIRAFLARTLDVAQGEAFFGKLNDAPVPAAAKELVAGTSGLFGFVPNLVYALAVEPSVLGVYIKMLQALAETTLDPIAQQVALGAASRANAADYAVAVHATLAGKLGASEDAVDTIRNGGAFKDPKLEAVRRFAAAIASKHTQVSDSDVNAFKTAGYDHRAAVAVALAVGAKALANTVAHLSRPALDEGFKPAPRMASTK